MDKLEFKHEIVIENEFNGRCLTCNGVVGQNLNPPYQMVCRQEMRQLEHEQQDRYMERMNAIYNANPQNYRGGGRPK